MKIFLFLIFLLIISDPVKCFKSEDFCIKNKQRKCEAYQCGKLLCSIDKLSCDNLYRWDEIVNNMKNSEYFKNTQYTNFKKFIQNIIRCIVKKDEQQWFEKIRFK